MPRRENSVGREAMQEFIAQEQHRVDLYRQQFGKCQTCDDFKDGFCGFWKAAVPEAAQPSGCDNWEHDFIPF